MKRIDTIQSQINSLEGEVIENLCIVPVVLAVFLGDMFRYNVRRLHDLSTRMQLGQSPYK